MKNAFKTGVLGLSLAAAVAGATVTPASAQVAPAGKLIFGVNGPADRLTAEPVQYFWGGRQFCWYDGGWHGPGWYWCGYAWRRGFGWGGPYGWRGWRGGFYGPRRGYYGHGPAWHGGYGHGPVDHGGGYGHGPEGHGGGGFHHEH